MTDSNQPSCKSTVPQVVPSIVIPTEGDAWDRLAAMLNRE
jgi:hypothetical protein